MLSEKNQKAFVQNAHNMVVDHDTPMVSFLTTYSNDYDSDKMYQQ